MSNTLSKVAFFTLGAAVGSVVTWKLLKSTYEQIANEEIESVKEMYQKKAEKEEEEIVDRFIDDSDSALFAVDDILKNEGYVSDSKKEEKGGSEPMDKLIKVIPPEDMGEIEEYDVVTLYYFADGVLTDDREEPLDDYDYIVGPDALTSFGVYEDDSVCVQNDDRKCYYEILQDTRSYSQITGPNNSLADLIDEYDEE